MIESLTEAQTKQLEVYKNKWIGIGLKTGPANRARAEKLINQAYEAAGLKAPGTIIWFDSPFSAKKYVDKNKLEDYRCYGSHDASWLSIYDYAYEVLELKEEVTPLLPMIELAKEVGWFWVYENACLISERPVRLSMAKNDTLGHKVLHDDHGPAIMYSDGTCGYYLNGVLIANKGKLMKEWVETPAEELDPKCILEAENVEVRRELIKKLGLDRVFDVLKTATLDTTTDGYELVDLNITDETTGRYLKMVNPSTSAIHLEGVPNECATVSQALAWRDSDEGEYVKPVALT